MSVKPSYYKKRPWPLIFLIVILFSGCVRIGPGMAGQGDKIRILILKGASSVNIRASDRGDIEIRKGADGVAVNNRIKDLPLRLYPKDGFIYINNKPFRGTIEIADSKDGLLLINELYLETYLVGIINNEISSRWPDDVIKTQAVIARTYAVYNRSKKAKAPYHVEGSVMGQVYSGAGSEDSAAMKAVKATRGEILVYGDSPALTVYHSNAGGMTDSSKDVWSKDYPYLRSVKSPHDEGSAQFTWDFTLHGESLSELLKSAGHAIGRVEAIEVDERTPAGRVKGAVIRDLSKSIRLSGEELRKAVGYSTLRSTIFEVEKAGELFVFRGKGSGHGVGLSQWGAKGMAEEGYSYREILRHYYPGTELRKAY